MAVCAALHLEDGFDYFVSNTKRPLLNAEALAKQYDAVLPYIERRRLDQWTHRKTIQKAIESYRVSDEHKQYLRTLK